MLLLFRNIFSRVGNSSFSQSSV